VPGGPRTTPAEPAPAGDGGAAPAAAALPRRWDAEAHPFRRFDNPELGRLLAQLGADRAYVRGEGCRLWDREGRRVLDFLAQYGALPFGFNPPRIWAALEAVRSAAEPSLVQPSYLEAAGELAERLIALAPPGMAYVTFANSGAEAVEAAIKLARSTTGRMGVLAARNGFHGKTLGALSATDKRKYQQPFGAPVPGFHYVPYGDAEALAEALADRAYAAFLVEPIQGEGGIVDPPVGYLREAGELCRKAGTLLVVDEVQTGLGRTGSLFACEVEGVTPDVLTLAKALGGGLLPIGACIATAAAYNEDFALNHTSTFAGNALACRAGLATLDLLTEDDRALVRAVARHGARLKRELGELQRRYPDLIRQVSGRGYLLGVKFGLDRASGGGGILGWLGESEALTALVVGHLLHFEGIRVGFTLNRGGVLRIEPPLIAGWEECREFLDGFERLLARLETLDAAVLTAHLTGIDPAAVVPAPPPQPRPRLRPPPGAGRFAFLVHPLEHGD
jgi:acetylornithine/succinyldiaminopimelate/putrescine aminotransferase